MSRFKWLRFAEYGFVVEASIDVHVRNVGTLNAESNNVLPF